MNGWKQIRPAKVTAERSSTQGGAAEGVGVCIHDIGGPLAVQSVWNRPGMRVLMVGADDEQRVGAIRI